MRRPKVALLALLAVGAVCAAGAGAAFWWLGSEQGTRWLASAVAARAGDALSLGDVRGSLGRRVVLEDVHLRTASGDLQVASIELTLDLRRLLGGTLAFRELALGDTRYRRMPGAGGGGRTALSFPLEVVVLNGTIARLALESGADRLDLGATRFAASLRARRLSIDRVATSARGLDLQGRAGLSWEDAVSVTAEVGWSGDLDGRALRGQTEVHGDWPRLHLHQELAEPFEAVADGEIVLDGEPRVDLRVDWKNLALQPWDRIASPNGRLRVAGAMDDFRFDGAGRAEVDGVEVGFDLAGRGEGTQLEISSLRLEHPSGSITVSGRLRLDSLDAALDLRARDIDPSERFPEWPGRLQLSARLEAHMRPEASLSLTDIHLEGQLRDRPVGATGALTYAWPGTWRLERVHATSGGDQVDLHGAVERGFDLDIRADLANLNDLWPGISGAATVQGHLGGDFATPFVRGRVEARSVELGGYRASVLRLSGGAGLAANAPADLRLSAEGLHRPGFAAVALSGRLSGTTGGHEARIEVESDGWTVQASLRGGLSDGRIWRGALESLTARQPQLGDWRLARAAALTFGAGVTLAPSCIVQDGARLCAAVQLRGGADDRISLDATDFDIGLLQPLFPAALSARGRYQASASLTRPSGRLEGTLSVRGGPTRLTLESAGQEPIVTQLDAMSMNASLKGRQLDLEAGLERGDTGSARMAIHIEDAAAEDPAISGRLDATWSELGSIALLSPDIGDVGGTVRADLTISGSLDTPRLGGRARWEEGRITVPRWGLAIDRIEADGSSADGATLQFTANGRVGDGEIDLSGVTELDRLAGWPTHLTLRGDSIQAVQLPEAQIFVSPSLNVEAELPDIRVTGTVLIPKADLSLDQPPAQAIGPSQDTVLHGVEQPVVARPLHLDSDLVVTLGDDVHYSGAGLDTSLAGQLNLKYQSGQPSSASGTLTISGTYDAYGRSLDLDRGQLFFTGPLDDPTLDIRAVRKVEDTTVGVQLTGTLKAPQTRMFSEPALSEADALAYLLLGRPLTSSGQAETATLQSAAISMGLQQALPVVERIGQSLGLDELSVRTTDADTGALMAGKYLSPKVYIRYSYGLFNRIGGLLLRFRVNDRLSLETRSGEQKSMDLLYTVEKQ